VALMCLFLFLFSFFFLFLFLFFLKKIPFVREKTLWLQKKMSTKSRTCGNFSSLFWNNILRIFLGISLPFVPSRRVRRNNNNGYCSSPMPQDLHMV
jgi:hypothetical protein